MKVSHGLKEHDSVQSNLAKGRIADLSSLADANGLMRMDSSDLDPI